jgi:hypothetical protein
MSKRVGPGQSRAHAWACAATDHLSPVSLFSSETGGRDRGGVSGLFLLGAADVDLEIHVPLAQHLGIGDDSVPAFEGDVVADLQDLADVVGRHDMAVLEVDARGSR